MATTRFNDWKKIKKGEKIKNESVVEILKYQSVKSKNKPRNTHRIKDE